MSGKTNNTTPLYPGQEVRLMQQSGQFVVVTCQGDKAVVRDEHGFDYPVSRAEVVTLHGKTIAAADTEPENSDLPAANIGAGLFLLFDPGAQEFSVLNACPHPAHLLLFASQKNNLELLWHGVLQKDEHSEKIPSALQDLKNLVISFLEVVPGMQKTPDWYSFQVKPSWQALSYVHGLYKVPVQWACLMPAGDYNEFLLKQSVAGSIPSHLSHTPATTSNSLKKQDVIDLHIDELTDESEKLAAHEKLQLQLSVFRKKIDECRLQGTEMLTVIHGVGKGILRGEVLKILADENGIRYKDAPYHEYGYGALVLTFY